MSSKKLFVWILAIAFPTAWILSVLRFDSSVFKTIFKVLFFPFGYIYLRIEEYYLGQGHQAIMGNEIVEILIWVAFILLQVFLYYFVLKAIKSWLKK
jgi:hypothetical protein